MSITPNSITELLPATYGAADMLAALQTRIGASSGSMLIAAGGAGDGFAWEFLADSGPQYIFRRLSGTTWAMSIEPTGSVTAVGDTVTPPTGTSADWSGERTFTLGTLGAGSKIWLTEHDDAITLLCKSADGTSWQNSLHIGRIYQPDFPNIDEPLGFDGLGFVFGSPFGSASQSTYFLTSQGSSTLPLLTVGLMHIGTERWSVAVSSTSFADSTAHDDPAYAPYVRPGVISITPIFRSNVAQYLATGRAKYMLRAGTPRVPLTRIDVNNLTDLAFIHGGAAGSISSSNNTIVFPWLRGVVP